MERLTKKYGSGIIPHKFGIACSVYCDNCSVGSGNCDDARNMIKRLAEIEDILGDNYELDRLRELAEADKDGRCVVLPKLENTVSAITAAKEIAFASQTHIPRDQWQDAAEVME